MKLERGTAKPRRYIQGARAQAAAATAQRIVDAFLARLMNQWFDEITLDGVAEDAGVTVQTLVRRFGSKQGLLAESVKTLTTQINARRASPPGDIGRLVGHLVADYEQTGDAVIRLLALEARHPALGTVIEFGRAEHRKWVAEVFAGALDALDVGARRRALDALVVTTDVYVWKLLRRDMARTVGAATAIMKGLIRATIADFSQSTSPGDGQR
ncbi:MAG TPA: TetR/AcrR family transcriptional regulator [Candidatus Dormibacteraeota bacterium]|nr:TetR/AcrR family transcriptional regulator [Candidatus Dormibacteraeota bacterium]